MDNYRFLDLKIKSDHRHDHEIDILQQVLNGDLSQRGEALNFIEAIITKHFSVIFDDPSKLLALHHDYDNLEDEKDSLQEDYDNLEKDYSKLEDKFEKLEKKIKELESKEGTT